MTTETRKRQNYTEDFKRDAVSLVTEQGYKISEAARSLDIGANLLGRWRRQFEEEASGSRLGVDEREELKVEIDMFDPADRQVIWRGAPSEVISRVQAS